MSTYRLKKKCLFLPFLCVQNTTRTFNKLRRQRAPQSKHFSLYFFRLTFSGTSPARATYPPLKGSRPHFTNATKHRDLGSRSRVFAKKTNKQNTHETAYTDKYVYIIRARIWCFYIYAQIRLTEKQTQAFFGRFIESKAVYDQSCSNAAVQGCPTRKASRSDDLGMVRLLTTLSYEQRVNK